MAVMLMGQGGIVGRYLRRTLVVEGFCTLPLHYYMGTECHGLTGPANHAHILTRGPRAHA